MIEIVARMCFLAAWLALGIASIPYYKKRNWHLCFESRRSYKLVEPQWWQWLVIGAFLIVMGPLAYPFGWFADHWYPWPRRSRS